MNTGTEVERIAYSPMELAQALKLSLNHVYALIGQGSIPHIRLGKRILIPKDVLMKMLADMTQGGEDHGAQPDEQA